MNQNFIPVIDDLDNFIGIVTRRDIISYLAKENENSFAPLFPKSDKENPPKNWAGFIVPKVFSPLSFQNFTSPNLVFQWQRNIPGIVSFARMSSISSLACRFFAGSAAQERPINRRAQSRAQISSTIPGGAANPRDRRGEFTTLSTAHPRSTMYSGDGFCRTPASQPFFRRVGVGSESTGRSRQQSSPEPT